MGESIDLYKEEREAQFHAQLIESMGPEIERYLRQEDVTEITINPEGKLILDVFRKGKFTVETTITPERIDNFISLLGTRVREECGPKNPELSAELNLHGTHRFHAILPPIVTNPSISIRRQSNQFIPLSRYVSDGVMTYDHSQFLRESFIQGKNIFIVGATGSGKTRLCDAIIDEIADMSEHIITIEDTRELRCRAKIKTQMKSKKGVRTMDDLLRTSLRFNPDRIIIGELRGAEAYTWLKALNTGHRGSIATAHANSAEQGLLRLETLLEEAGQIVSKRKIATAVDIVAYLEKLPKEGHKLLGLIEVSWDSDSEDYLIKKIVGDEE